MADILLGNVRGPIGPEGQPGATGETGQAATIEIGSVSTTAYGNPAQVVNSGTEEAAILDFTIPQGKPGEQTTRMGALTLDTITAQTATFPVPAVGETGSTVFGKIIKFFTDTVSALASKLNVSDVINNLTSTATDKPLSANMGRQLNSNINTITTTDITYSQNSYVTSTGANIPLYAIGKIGIIRCNMEVASLPAGQTNKVIGAYSGKTFAMNTFVNIASQTGKGTILMAVSTDGKVSVSNLSGSDASGFYRMSIPLLLA